MECCDMKQYHAADRTATGYSGSMGAQCEAR